MINFSFICEKLSFKFTLPWFLSCLFLLSTLAVVIVVMIIKTVVAVVLVVVVQQ